MTVSAPPLRDAVVDKEGMVTVPMARWLQEMREGANSAISSVIGGATTAILVGGGADTAPVWTTATGTGAPVRAGTPSFTTTIGVGAATGSASGAGITFPATQSASTNANTLDDYEEGTWTPTFSGGTTPGSPTYSTRAGYYVKVGKLVYAQFRIDVTNNDTAAGNAQIGSFPFTSSNDSASDVNVGSLTIGAATYNFQAGYTMANPYLANNATAAILVENGDSVANVTTQVAQLTATWSILGNIKYRASA